MTFGVAILTVSDTASTDASTDKSGPALREILQNTTNSTFRIVQTRIVPDDKVEIRDAVKRWSEDSAIDWIITTGGTGFGVRDCTPEVRDLSG